ncbi:flagellar hook-associated protein 2 [Pueribacillus theae]|uniref:Flagellar hook-associated protein 2 n=1 Tax=Pueribacillus theae TaxID=2171751 RepID=A0A2U1K5G8_9BACI|nr:flagellar hook-associated protein 2 [Pueribacillus theae]PWA12622.1 flagellar hook-associated protein 2 [Pueribacillus theae]
MQVNRFAGLASGMDTESIIKDLMRAERYPLDRLVQKKQVLEWQRDSYRDVNKLLTAFSDLTFDGVFRQATFLKKTVSSSNDSAVSAKAINPSGNVSTQIEVSQLATSEVWVSADDPQFTSGERTLTFNVTKPGESEPTEVKIEISANDTLGDVIKRFNSSNFGVTIFEDRVGEKSHLVMTMNATGVGAKIEVVADEDGSNSTKDFMEKLGFKFNNGVLENGPKGKEGKNAKFTINGYETERTSNVFTINGIEYTLKNTTEGKPVTISTANDTDFIFDTVVKFVDEYNKLIADLNGRLQEKVYRDFKPLTEEQREDMSEKQIEMWEEKAKSGMLRNDSIISGGLNQMRLDLYSTVELADGTKLHLADFGITSSKDYLERGKLEVNEDKLREAIANDPNKLYELFNGTPGTTKTSFEKQGIAARLRASIKSVTTNIEARAGNNLRTNHQFTLGRNLIDVDKQIDRMQERLKRLEESYWRQFTAMEKAVQQANQQSAYLMQQFGGF